MKEDADNQLSEIASSIPPLDPSCVELQQSAFLAQLLLEEVVTRSRGGPGHGTLRWTRASEQAGKALRSQGHQCAHVM